MRLICSLILFIWLGSAHAETQSAATLNANELSTASVAELDEKKVQAQQANDALAALLEGVSSADKLSEKDSINQSEKSGTTRLAEPRADEDAIAEIPPALKKDVQMGTFESIRMQLLQKSAGEGQVLLSDFLTRHPLHREAQITLARLQVLDNKPAAALQTLDSLVASVAAKDHADWQPWFWAGTAHLALGEIESARRMLDVAVAKEGRVVEIWVQLAVLEQELDNHSAALQYIGIAEQIDGNAAQIYLNRAYSLERLGEFDAALSAYQQFMASEMTPNAETLRPSVMRRIALLAERQQTSEQDFPRSS